ncbi:MAG: TlpA family protein disulfide reductase [Alphaproteobacteria bacterium]|nr:TlpA family protein disulfide reductase [Alphaproteobacteria bacterium]
MALYQQLDAATQAMDWDKARALLDKAKAEAGHTRVASRFARVAEEIAVIGKPAPALEVERWYQGQTDLNQGKATLVVFWEEWCPHCRREVPALEATYEQLSGEGLNVVALTRITRSSTEEKVQTFIRDSGLTYPVARLGDDKMNEAFGVSGIPAAAVVVDGEIAWRGHRGASTRRRSGAGCEPEGSASDVDADPALEAEAARGRDEADQLVEAPGGHLREHRIDALLGAVLVDLEPAGLQAGVVQAVAVGDEVADGVEDIEAAADLRAAGDDLPDLLAAVDGHGLGAGAAGAEALGGVGLLQAEGLRVALLGQAQVEVVGPGASGGGPVPAVRARGAGELAPHGVGAGGRGREDAVGVRQELEDHETLPSLVVVRPSPPKA